MGKKNKIKTTKRSAIQASSVTTKKQAPVNSSHLLYLVVVVFITALCFWPMLDNGFTNWDDEFYVIQNQLLRGPDWEGIFSKPVVSNYHPLTVATLALNYQSTELDPSSYLMMNFVLHLINTALVFLFVWKLSDKKHWVAFFTALIF